MCTPSPRSPNHDFLLCKEHDGAGQYSAPIDFKGERGIQSSPMFLDSLSVVDDLRDTSERCPAGRLLVKERNVSILLTTLYILVSEKYVEYVESEI